jgi:hypothetical protein
MGRSITTILKVTGQRTNAEAEEQKIHESLKADLRSRLIS